MSFLKKLNNFNLNRKFISNEVNRFLKFGLDIDGNQNNGSGYSISMGDNSNNYLAVGSPFDTAAGRVRVYSWNGSVWSQVGTDILGEASGDESGASVCLRTTISNTTNPIVAIGAPNNGAGNGHVRIWRWSGASWSRYGGSTDLDGNTGSGYPGEGVGFSVALNKAATRLFIGAPYSNSDTGRVLSYTLTTSSATYTSANLGLAPGHLFGYSVSADNSNNIVVIGAPGGNFARIMSWSNNASTSSTLANLTGGLNGQNDFFGGSVAINNFGDTVIVGAKDYDSSTGYVKIYSNRANGSTWVQIGQTIFGDKAWDYFGRSVSIDKSGDRIIVGGVRFAKVYFYEGNVWKPKGGQINGKIIGESSGTNFGTSVSMHGDGNIFAIGDDENSPPNKSAAGSVRTYYDYVNRPSTVNTEDISSV